MQRLLNILLVLIFLASGGAKLAALDFEVAAFTRWGFPLWFMTLTGVLEVAGAVGLLMHRLAALAAGCLALLMLGAIATHVLHAEWLMLILATAICAAAAWRSWLGRQELRALAKSLTHGKT
ncbi:MAG: DoxX family protein [Pseudazoarcus pumilus]|nr:DoxX family protein [Pseudazoarcus pumilus]